METERQLISRAQSGNADAFRKLVDLNKHGLYRICYDLTGNVDDACDLSQDVFVQAFQGIHSFRGEAKFSSWLYRIAVNLWLSRRRKKATHLLHFWESERFDDYADQRNGHENNPEQFAESKLMQLNISRALNKLSAREKAIFVLRHYHDLSLKEIAGILDIKLGTVKSLLFRAIKKLQKELSFYRQEFKMEKNNEQMQ